MLKRIFAIGALGCASTAIAAAQAVPPTTQDSRLDRLEQKLDQLQSDVKARDQRIEQLEAELAKRPPATSQPAAMAAPPSPGTPASSQPDTSGLSDIDKTTQDMLKDIQTKEAATPTLRFPANFNPNFAVIGDFAGNVSSEHRNPAMNRFDLREIELDLRAAVDPRADAVVILPVDRSIANPLFFDQNTRQNDNVDTSISIEEAYITLHDFGVPNLVAKLGRFHLHFGRWNLLHLHAWPTVDNAFVVQSFLGPESLADSGASFSYIVPPGLIGGQYVEADAEIITGEGERDDPVLNNGAYVTTPGVNFHLLWNHDLGPDWNFEVGGSFLHGHHNDSARQYANVFGTDLTLMRRDPTGRFNNQFFQAEVMYGNVDNRAGNPQHSAGAFLVAQQQLNRDWYGGVRLDWTQNAVNEHQEVWGVSPFVTWYWSEFLMFRLEYQHKGGDVLNADSLFFQCDFVFGAHPPHPYWSVKG
ncbi:MAG TPA: hypothetical protein VIM11_02315 [Tepidisphaeraceae bacterium]